MGRKGIKVLIIEDEKLAADRLEKMLLEYDPSIKIVERLDSIKASVELLEKTAELDLIFMDIHISDGLCFDIFEKTNIKVPVVFTTAFNEYALKAFKVNSIDYLLKPIAYKELEAAINKYQSLQEHYELLNKESVQDVKEMILHDYKTRFIVKAGSHIQTIFSENICCFYSKDSLSFILTSEGKKFPVDYSLEQIENFVDPTLFFRINRKFILNIKFIQNIQSYTNSRLKVALPNFREDEIIVSRERVQAFKAWLDSRVK